MALHVRARTLPLCGDAAAGCGSLPGRRTLRAAVWAIRMGPLPRGGGGQRLRGDRLQCARFTFRGTGRVAGGRCAPRCGPRLLPDSAVSRSPLQVGCRYLNWISSGSSGRALSGTLTPSVFWLSHRDRPGRGLQVRRPGRSRFQLSANNGQHGPAELADGVPRAVHRAGACRAVPGHEPDAARRACPFGQVAFAAAWPAACRPGHGYVDLAELAWHQYGPGFDSAPTRSVSRSASPALIATRT